jgi:hypothetical protein
MTAVGHRLPANAPTAGMTLQPSIRLGCDAAEPPRAAASTCLVGRLGTARCVAARALLPAAAATGNGDPDVHAKRRSADASAGAR